MKWAFAVVLAISASLFSCGARNTPARITVRAPDGFSGVLHLTPCAAGAQGLVEVNQQGNGETSACPSGDVEVLVVKNSGTVYIEPQRISVSRAGDGIPVEIIVPVP
jgi:hypothetical protein